MLAPGEPQRHAGIHPRLIHARNEVLRRCDLRSRTRIHLGEGWVAFYILLATFAYVRREDVRMEVDDHAADDSTQLLPLPLDPFTLALWFNTLGGALAR